MDRIEIKGLATAGQTTARILGVAAGGDKVAAGRATAMELWYIRRERRRCLRKQRSLDGDGHTRVAVHSRSSGGRHTTGKRQLFSRAGHIVIARKKPPVESVLGGGGGVATFRWRWWNGWAFWSKIKGQKRGKHNDGERSRWMGGGCQR